MLPMDVAKSLKHQKPDELKRIKLLKDFQGDLLRRSDEVGSSSSHAGGHAGGQAGHAGAGALCQGEGLTA